MTNILSAIPKLPPKKRKLECWIDSFVSITENLPVSPLLRKWAAVACVAGVLERRIWMAPLGRILYPNVYVVLLAGAGVGKSIIADEVRQYWEELDDFHIAPSNVSRATLIDSLVDAKRRIVRIGEDPPFVEYNALSVVSNELGVFIPEWDGDFINHLTDLWDGKVYHERKRTGSLNIIIPKPILTILGCTTPSWLGSTLPAVAWDQGFTSRTLFAYSERQIIKDLTGLRTPTLAAPLNQDLLEDLRKISSLYGFVMFTADAAEVIRKWHLSGGQPAPDHPKLEQYLTRRTVHVLKLCMILCASQRDDLIVTLEIFQQAQSMLIELESTFIPAFDCMIQSSDDMVLREVLHKIRNKIAATRKPCQSSYVYSELSRRTQINKVPMMLYSLINQNKIKGVGGGFILGDMADTENV